MIQTYNSKSKKFVLIDNTKKAGIVNMQPVPFEGVPIKGEYPEKFKDAAPDHEDKKEDKSGLPSGENMDNKESGGGDGWLY